MQRMCRNYSWRNCFAHYSHYWAHYNNRNDFVWNLLPSRNRWQTKQFRINAFRNHNSINIWKQINRTVLPMNYRTDWEKQLIICRKTIFLFSFRIQMSWASTELNSQSLDWLSVIFLHWCHNKSLLPIEINWNSFSKFHYVFAIIPKKILMNLFSLIIFR